MMLRRNVLIFHQAALGDFIITWPLAMALSRIMPQHRIIYVTHSQKGALAERLLRVESVDSEAGWHHLLVAPPEVPQLPERPAKLLAGAHLVVSFTAGTADTLADGIKRFSPDARTISLDTRANSEAHASASLVEQLRPEPALAAAMEQMLRSIETRGVGLALKPAGRIVIHPGAGKESNRWPAERFLELTTRLRDNGKDVVVLLGETEIERWPAELVGQFSAIAEVRRPETLLNLADELAAADAFIGNDSGPGHLAGIMGVRTVSLFGGSSDPRRWSPLGPRVSVIQRKEIAAIAVSEVYDAVVAV